MSLSSYSLLRGDAQQLFTVFCKTASNGSVVTPRLLFFRLFNPSSLDLPCGSNVLTPLIITTAVF